LNSVQTTFDWRTLPPVLPNFVINNRNMTAGQTCDMWVTLALFNTELNFSTVTVLWQILEKTVWGVVNWFYVAQNKD